MLVSGRVIGLLFVFGAKIVDFFATLMMRSLFYSLKKNDKNAPSEAAAKKNPMAGERRCGIRASVRIPPVRRTKALLTAIGLIDPNCSSWPGLVGSSFLGAPWLEV